MCISNANSLELRVLIRRYPAFFCITNLSFWVSPHMLNVFHAIISNNLTFIQLVSNSRETWYSAWPRQCYCSTMFNFCQPHRNYRLIHAIQILHWYLLLRPSIDTLHCSRHLIQIIWVLREAFTRKTWKERERKFVDGWAWSGNILGFMVGVIMDQTSSAWKEWIFSKYMASMMTIASH